MTKTTGEKHHHQSGGPKNTTAKTAIASAKQDGELTIQIERKLVEYVFFIIYRLGWN